MESQNIIFNRSLVIRSKANSDNNPLVQHFFPFIATIFIFTKDSTGIKVESVDWENIVLAKISHTKNISVELNNCHFNVSMGVGFIKFSSDINGINLKICDSEVNGNWKLEGNTPITWDFGTLDGDKIAQFINSSFKSVGILVKGLRDLHIEECFFKNGAIFVQDLRYLYIHQTVFDAASSSYINHDTLNGRVLVIHSSNASITNCDFINNTISVMYLFNSTVSIENTTFINNTLISNGNFSLERLLDVQLSNVALWRVTFFQNKNYTILIYCQHSNMETENSSISFNEAICLFFSHKTASLRKTKLIKNSVYFAIVATRLFIHLCNFENNTVEKSLILGGTGKYFTWSRPSVIQDTNITMNIISDNVIKISLKNHSIAIYRLKVWRNSFWSCFSILNGKALIHNSVISDNNATGVGKLVNFHEKSTFSATTFSNIDEGLEMKDVSSLFNAKKLENPVLFVELQRGFLIMKNVTLQLPEATITPTMSVIDIATDKRNLNSTLDLKVNCPVNYNPSNSTHVSERSFRYRLSCESCPRGLYSSYGGSEHINGVYSKYSYDLFAFHTVIARISSVKKSFNCTTCPPGAICNFKLLSRENFYGFMNKNGKYEFITCPKSYCCSQEGAKCTSYDTCNVNRNGRLCGSCTEGNYISYFSDECVETSKCTASTRLIFWIFYFSSAVFLTLTLCFTEDLLNVLKMIFLFIKRKILKKSMKKNQKSSKHEENSRRESTEIQINSCITRSNKNLIERNDRKQFSYSAIFNVLVSFYQLQSLLQVPVDRQDQKPFNFLVSNFFNLDIMLKRVDKYCPLKSNSVIYRDALKNIFLPLSMVLIILIIMFIRKFCILLKARFPRTVLLISKHFQISLSLTERLYIGYYVVITFNYKKLASIAFRLIHCVEIKGSNVLYFAGDVDCYKYWQKLDICFLVVWIIPFPAAVVTGYYLLKKNKISAWIFMVCFTFPPMTIIVFLTIRYSNFNVKIKSKGEDEENINSRLKDIFEEPYRKNYFWWEAWTLYERLIVACIVTFSTDPVIRLYSLTPVLVLFLWFHNWAKPYKPSMKILFNLDILSYICLCFNLVSNMIRAVVYIYSLPPLQYLIDKSLDVTRYLEFIFSPLWPLIVYFIVAFTMKKLKKY